MGGRRQINTMNDLAKQLEIKDGKNITILEVKSLKLNQRIMSFAVRPLVYNSKIISSYYFRVLYTKKNETKYLPMDSNLGNLCIPEKHDSNDDFYYCNLKLKNDYNELSKKFAASSTNQNEYFKINISGRYKNGTIFEDTKDFYYVYDKIIKDIDYFKFKFIFENNEMKNIICSFSDKVENIYPQIYSAQMYYLDNNKKSYNFKLIEKYLIKSQII